jgi:hypothetical protein
MRPDRPLVEMALGHLLSLIDADPAWTGRARDALRADHGVALAPGH